ncbi:RBR2 [Scenedesmus sp. PABB004]|nr:RBR2 [Scenedesmus sp. PABB004]
MNGGGERTPRRSKGQQKVRGGAAAAAAARAPLSPPRARPARAPAQFEEYKARQRQQAGSPSKGSPGARSAGAAAAGDAGGGSGAAAPAPRPVTQRSPERMMLQRRLREQVAELQRQLAAAACRAGESPAAARDEDFVRKLEALAIEREELLGGLLSQIRAKDSELAESAAALKSSKQREAAMSQQLGEALVVVAAASAASLLGRSSPLKRPAEGSSGRDGGAACALSREGAPPSSGQQQQQQEQEQELERASTALRAQLDQARAAAAAAASEAAEQLERASSALEFERRERAAAARAVAAAEAARAEAAAAADAALREAAAAQAQLVEALAARAEAARGAGAQFEEMQAQLAAARVQLAAEREAVAARDAALAQVATQLAAATGQHEAAQAAAAAAAAAAAVAAAQEAAGAACQREKEALRSVAGTFQSDFAEMRRAVAESKAAVAAEVEGLNAKIAVQARQLDEQAAAAADERRLLQVALSAARRERGASAARRERAAAARAEAAAEAARAEAAAAADAALREAATAADAALSEAAAAQAQLVEALAAQAETAAGEAEQVAAVANELAAALGPLAAAGRTVEAAGAQSSLQEGCELLQLCVRRMTADAACAAGEAEQLAGAVEALRELREQLAAHSAALVAKQGELEEAASTAAAAASQEAAGLHGRAAATEAALAAVRQQADEAGAELAGARQQLQAAAAQHRQEVEQLSAALSAARCEHAAAAGAAAAAEAARAEAAAAADAALAEGLASAQGQVEELRDKLRKAVKKGKAIEADRAGLAAALEAAQAQLAAAEGETEGGQLVQQLQQQLEVALRGGDLGQLQEACDALEAARTQLAAAQMAAHAQRERDALLLADAQRQQAALQARCDADQAALAEARGALADAADAADAAERRAALDAQQLRQAREQHQAALAQLEAARQDAATAQQQWQAHQAQVEAAAAQQVHGAVEQLAMLQGQLQQLLSAAGGLAVAQQQAAAMGQLAQTAVAAAAARASEGDDAQALRAEHAALTEGLASAQGQVEELRDKLRKAVKKGKAIEADRAGLAAALEAAQAQLAAAEGETEGGQLVQQLQQQLEVALRGGDLGQLQEACDALEAARTQLAAAQMAAHAQRERDALLLADAQRQQAALQARCDADQAALAEARGALADAADAADAAERRAALDAQQLRQAREQHQAALAQLEAARQDAATAQQQWQAHQAQAEAAAAQQVHGAVEQLAMLQGQLQQLLSAAGGLAVAQQQAAAMGQLAQTAVAAAAARASEGDDAQALRAEHAALTEGLASAQGQVEELRDKLRKAVKKGKAIEADRAGLAAALEAAQAQLAAAEGETEGGQLVQQLQQQLEVALRGGDLGQLQEACDALEAARTQLAAAQMAAHAQRERDALLLADAQRQQAALQARCDADQAALAEARGALADAADAADAAERRAALDAQQLRQAREQHQAALAQLEAARQDAATAQQQWQAHQAQVEAAAAQQVHGAVEQLAMLQGQLQQLLSAAGGLAVAQQQAAAMGQLAQTAGQVEELRDKLRKAVKKGKAIEADRAGLAAALEAAQAQLAAAEGETEGGQLVQQLQQQLEVALRGGDLGQLQEACDALEAARTQLAAAQMAAHAQRERDALLLADAQRQQAALQARCDADQAALAEARGALADAADAADAAERRAALDAQQLRQAREQHQAALAQLEAARQDAATAQQQWQAHQAQAEAAAAQQVHGAVEQLAMLQGQLQQLLSAAGGLAVAQQQAAAMGQLAQTAVAAAAARASEGDDAQALRAEHAALTEGLASAQGQVEELRDKLRKAVKKGKAIEADRAGLAAALEAAQAQAQQHAAAAALAQEQAEALEALQACNLRLQQALQQALPAAQRASDLDGELAAAVAAREQLAGAAAAAEAAAAGLAARVEELEVARQADHAKLARAREAITKLQSDRQALEGELTAAHEDAAAAAQPGEAVAGPGAADAREALAAQQLRIEALELDLAAARALAADAQAAADGHQEQLAAQSAQLAAALAQAQQLREAGELAAAAAGAEAAPAHVAAIAQLQQRAEEMEGHYAGQLQLQQQHYEAALAAAAASARSPKPQAGDDGGSSAAEGAAVLVPLDTPPLGPDAASAAPAGSDDRAGGAVRRERGAAAGAGGVAAADIEAGPSSADGAVAPAGGSVERAAAALSGAWGAVATTVGGALRAAAPAGHEAGAVGGARAGLQLGALRQLSALAARRGVQHPRLQGALARVDGAWARAARAVGRGPATLSAARVALLLYLAALHFALVAVRLHCGADAAARGGPNALPGGRALPGGLPGQADAGAGAGGRPRSAWLLPLAAALVVLAAGGAAAQDCASLASATQQAKCLVPQVCSSGGGTVVTTITCADAGLVCCVRPAPTGDNLPCSEGGSAGVCRPAFPTTNCLGTFFASAACPTDQKCCVPSTAPGPCLTTTGKQGKCLRASDCAAAGNVANDPGSQCPLVSGSTDAPVCCTPKESPTSDRINCGTSAGGGVCQPSDGSFSCPGTWFANDVCPTGQKCCVPPTTTPQLCTANGLQGKCVKAADCAGGTPTPGLCGTSTDLVCCTPPSTDTRCNEGGGAGVCRPAFPTTNCLGTFFASAACPTDQKCCVPSTAPGPCRTTTGKQGKCLRASDCAAAGNVANDPGSQCPLVSGSTDAPVCCTPKESSTSDRINCGTSAGGGVCQPSDGSFSCPGTWFANDVCPTGQKCCVPPTTTPQLCTANGLQGKCVKAADCAGGTPTPGLCGTSTDLVCCTPPSTDTRCNEGGGAGVCRPAFPTTNCLGTFFASAACPTDQKCCVPSTAPGPCRTTTGKQGKCLRASDCAAAGNVANDPGSQCPLVSGSTDAPVCCTPKESSTSDRINCGTSAGGGVCQPSDGSFSCPGTWFANDVCPTGQKCCVPPTTTPQLCTANGLQGKCVKAADCAGGTPTPGLCGTSTDLVCCTPPSTDTRCNEGGGAGVCRPAFPTTNCLGTFFASAACPTDQKCCVPSTAPGPCRTTTGKQGKCLRASDCAAAGNVANDPGSQCPLVSGSTDAPVCCTPKESSTSDRINCGTSAGGGVCQPSDGSFSCPGTWFANDVCPTGQKCCVPPTTTPQLCTANGLQGKCVKAADCAGGTPTPGLCGTSTDLVCCTPPSTDTPCKGADGAGGVCRPSDDGTCPNLVDSPACGERAKCCIKPPRPTNDTAPSTCAAFGVPGVCVRAAACARSGGSTVPDLCPGAADGVECCIVRRNTTGGCAGAAPRPQRGAQHAARAPPPGARLTRPPRPARAERVSQVYISPSAEQDGVCATGQSTQRYALTEEGQLWSFARGYLQARLTRALGRGRALLPGGSQGPGFAEDSVDDRLAAARALEADQPGAAWLLLALHTARAEDSGACDASPEQLDAGCCATGPTAFRVVVHEARSLLALRLAPKLCGALDRLRRLGADAYAGGPCTVERVGDGAYRELDSDNGVAMPALVLELGASDAAGDVAWFNRRRPELAGAIAAAGEAAEEAWRPCIVWLLKATLFRSAEGDAPPPAAGLPLGELLDAAHLDLVSFFRELPVVLNKVRPVLCAAAGVAGEDVEGLLRLREWQETLVSLGHIASKYKDLFWHVQRSASTPKQPLLRAGWLAFLLIKAQLLPGFPDLVSCLELLVCVLNLFVASTPFSAEQLDALRSANPGAIEASGRLSTLKALASEAKVDLGNTKRLMPQVEARFRALFADGACGWAAAPLAAGAPHPQAAAVDTCCGLYLEGLTTNAEQLGELVLALDGAYGSWYRAQGEIDEREFLLNDYGALASPRTRPTTATAAPAQAAALPAAAAPSSGSGGGSGGGSGAGSGSGAGGGGGAAALAAAGALAGLAAGGAGNGAKPPLAPGGAARRPIAVAGLQSPLPLMHLGPPHPATPISQAMGSVAWLRGLGKDAGVSPGAALQRYMAAAGADAGQLLVSRVQRAACAVFMADAPPGGGAGGDAGGAGGEAEAEAGAGAFPEVQQVVAQERRDEGVKLYWHVLQAMLAAEEARAGLPAAAELVSRAGFHACLLACAFEVVAATYRMGLLSFPAIPAKLGLRPFDLVKIIGPFVRAEPSLPRELKRHMFTVEEKILESLGWAPGSSLYALARAAAGQAPPRRASDSGGAGAAGAERAAGGGDAEMRDGGGGGGGGGEGVPLEAAEGRAEPQQQALPQATAEAEPEQRPDAGGSRKRAGAHSSSATPEPMDAEAAPGGDGAPRAGAGPAPPSLAPKRQRGEDGGVTSHPHAAEAFAPEAPEAPLPRALGAPGAPPPPGGDASARAVLLDYARKVLKLAAFRLVAVSEGLDFSPMEREDVVAAVHEVLSHALHHHTYLFYGRHLDTLLLASLYGYCKVHRLNQVTFREIIGHYKRQAHAKQEVFRTVVLAQSDPGLVATASGDIIAFYNAVYVPAMKGHLLTTVAQPGRARAGSQEPGCGGEPGGAAGGAADSPIVTALLHAAAQQAAVARGWGGAPGGAPGGAGGAGSAYRALSLAGGGGGLAGLGSSLAGLGSSLGGGLEGSASPLQSPGAGSGLGAAPDVGGLGGLAGGGGWGADAGGGVTIAAALAGPLALARSGTSKAALAAAAPQPAAPPSRLSRLSRACSAAGHDAQAAAKGAEAAAAAAAAAADQQRASPSAAPGQGTRDAARQPDQGAAAAGAAAAMECDGPAAVAGLAAAQAAPMGSPISVGGAGAGSASPAGLATLLQALDTSRQQQSPPAAVAADS